jgi:hypothetical protein
MTIVQPDFKVISLSPREKLLDWFWTRILKSAPEIFVEVTPRSSETVTVLVRQ